MSRVQGPSALSAPVTRPHNNPPGGVLVLARFLDQKTPERRSQWSRVHPGTSSQRGAEAAIRRRQFASHTHCLNEIRAGRAYKLQSNERGCLLPTSRVRGLSPGVRWGRWRGRKETRTPAPGAGVAGGGPREPLFPQALKVGEVSLPGPGFPAGRGSQWGALLNLHPTLQPLQASHSPWL